MSKQAERSPTGANPPGVSDEAVRAATGRGWDEWRAALDAAGAREWSHREIVAHIASEHPQVSGWWQQSITVAYEKAHGRRVVGQTADAGFQLGVQRRLAATPAEVWELVTTRPELWLGEGIAFREGERYRVTGAEGEVRVVKPGLRLRLTWRPDGWEKPATLQLTLDAPRPGTTALGVHLERLPDADAREAMRTRFRAALERIVAALEESRAPS